MATSCTSGSTSRRIAAALALAAAAFAAAAGAETVTLVPPSPASVDVAVLDSAHDVGSWRLGVVRSRFHQVLRYGFLDIDGGEDEYAFDCAKGDYTYARRTLTLAGVVVENRVIPPSRWATLRFPIPPKGSIIALARDRFCALGDVPVR